MKRTADERGSASAGVRTKLRQGLESIRDRLLRGRCVEVTPPPETRSAASTARPSSAPPKSEAAVPAHEVPTHPPQSFQAPLPPLLLATRILIDLEGQRCSAEVYEVQSDGRYTLLLHDPLRFSTLLPDIGRERLTAV